MKKLLALLLCMMMLVPMAAMAQGTTEITLWTYPIGNWKDSATVDGIIANFNAQHPEIKVTVQYLDYQSGDDQVTGAIEAKTTPDIIMEGPERLVTNWGAMGKMADLTDLWTEEALADINANSPVVAKACMSADGKYYEYPLCMTTHCMAINYEAFEKADALQYLNQETRTWTTEDFGKALQALTDAGLTPTGVVYCGGQGGDQGTRALAMNLYSAKFTNEDYTAYTMDSEAGQKGLKQLQDWVNAGILSADAGIVASDELQLFANGTAQMSFCWNASNKANYASTATFTPFAMAFPSDDGVPELCGGIYGFGIFDNGDEAKIAAAKTFIQYVCDDKTQGPASVYETGFFPARASFGDIYTGTEKAANAEFVVFAPYLGDYYNVVSGWAAQRTEWWNLLQRVFGGGDVATEVAAYVTNANGNIMK